MKSVTWASFSWASCFFASFRCFATTRGDEERSHAESQKVHACPELLTCGLCRRVRARFCQNSSSLQSLSSEYLVWCLCGLPLSLLVCTSEISHSSLLCWYDHKRHQVIKTCSCLWNKVWNKVFNPCWQWQGAHLVVNSLDDNQNVWKLLLIHFDSSVLQFHSNAFSWKQKPRQGRNPLSITSWRFDYDQRDYERETAVNPE